MKIIFAFAILLISSKLLAQTETFDLATFTPPKGWKKETKENVVTFSFINNSNSTWCQIGIIKSTVSKGSIDLDFNNEWQELIVKNYGVTEKPEINEAQEADGWKIKAGGGKFIFNNSNAIALLTTMSGYNRCISVVATTNSTDYLEQIQQFLETFDLKKPDKTTPPPAPPVQNAGNTARKDGFSFSTTNFDDGWISVAKEDWVEVSRNNITVYLHYPKEGTIFPADPEPLTNAAWNILVAPRYQKLRNYRATYINTYNRVYLASGYATSNSTGKEMYLVFFRQGQTGWLEIATPDKNTFISQFGFDPEVIRWDSESALMDPLVKMTAYNKFAVSATDFKGTWTSDFTGIQQLYHVYTGQYGGMKVNQSSQTFQFNAGNTYNWKIVAVNGTVGNMDYGQAKSAGKLTVLNNWQIQCSNIEGKAKKYHAYFSCIKGARILWLLDADYPGSGVYTAFGKKD